MNNLRGKRGENIFSVIISRPVKPAGYLFDPVFLGDKYPTVDYLVSLLSYPHKNLHFMASVKSTSRGYNASRSKLLIQIDACEIAELQKFQVPVYLFGIDEVREKAYYINANKLECGNSLCGLPTTYPLNRYNLRRLWKEVIGYYSDSLTVENTLDFNPQ